MLTRSIRLAVLLVASTSTLVCTLTPSAHAQPPLDEYIVLSWNDLGMHCMNRDHDLISILPPYNDLLAQVIRRGDAFTLPQIVTAGVTLEYSIPGNTYSVGKTNFWTYAFDLFGVNLPPDVGLTGLGLSGAFTLHGTRFSADGIPITPFPDAAPTVEDPYQQALVILRDAQGNELHRSGPVIPVSTEMNCVSSGCHGSVQGIINQHSDEGGFDPAAVPILCAGCHGSTPLTGPNPGTAGWFSFRIHEKHTFLDETLPGLDGCQKCHPGPVTQCLRGTMATDFGMICQDCHGDMEQMAASIAGGRIPWLEEPACRDCHTAQYGEPAGQLYRESTGHGGVQCAACHGSPHAIWPSREPRDNANAVDLQGHSGTLRECWVCHGTTPAGPGPHGLTVTGVIEDEILGGAGRLAVSRNPLPIHGTTELRVAGADPDRGRMLIFSADGRTVRLLPVQPDGTGGVRTAWDGLDGSGRALGAGVYFARWDGKPTSAAAKIVVVD